PLTSRTRGGRFVEGDELRCWYTGNGFGKTGMGYAVGAGEVGFRFSVLGYGGTATATITDDRDRDTDMAGIVKSFC
ncbi:MAG: hypothetical protein ABII82_09580, partial [Verrucomicrobiota bacterium]